MNIQISPEDEWMVQAYSWRPDVHGYLASLHRVLGSFETAEMAGAAYQQAAIKLHGEFARY